MLRLDKLHPVVSGNKWFKLKYNLEAARQQGKRFVLTFGGAYSNHLAATAAACRLLGFKSIGIVRGERPPQPGATLQMLQREGMELHFISREDYRRKQEHDFLQQLRQRFGDAYIIPEGGHNEAGVKGCEEILPASGGMAFTHICCAVGTGTMMAGLVRSAMPSQIVTGFPALKQAHYLEQEITQYLRPEDADKSWRLFYDYHFGGFAKYNSRLTDFMNDFYREHHVPLDIVYTGKMVYGVLDLVRKDAFPPGSKILLVHSGGLQGNRSLKKGILNYA